MNIAFIQNFDFEYLGVMSICAVLKRNGHTPKVFVNPWERDLLSSLKQFNPDVIAFPTYSGSQGWVFATAKELKRELKAVTVVGGPHATFTPDIIKNPGIDIICRGEGEYPMLELLDAMENKKSYLKIKNLWIKRGKRIIKNPIRPLIDPLDSLPPPDREVYYHYARLANAGVKNFNVGRGCPFNCAYCHNSGLVRIYSGLGRYVRFTSPKRMIEQIAEVKSKYKIKTVHFVDDLFVSNPVWVSKFLDLYIKKINLPFVCNLRGGMLTDALARKMAKAGCISTFIGIESGNQELRIKILKKYVTDESLKKTCAILHKYHIQIAGNNMVGLPEETVDEAVETIKLNAELKIDLPWCAVFQPYPGTELAEYCLEKGYVTSKDLAKIGVFFHKNSIVKNPDIKELVRLHKLFHLGVWMPFSIPIIRILIKLPLDPVYQLIFLVNQGMTWMKFTKLTPIEFALDAWSFARFYFVSSFSK